MLLFVLDFFQFTLLMTEMNVDKEEGEKINLMKKHKVRLSYIGHYAILKWFVRALS